VNRLTLSGHPASTFDVALSGFLHPASVVHKDDVLAEILKILRPKGALYLREPCGSDTELNNEDSLVSSLKLSGFVNISKPSATALSAEEVNELQKCLNVKEIIQLLQVKAEKPEYEVGASTQLKLSFASKPKVDENAAAVWTLSANDMMDDDLIDSDALLDENDLKKPDPETLRAECGPGSGNKKACKNCTCGLAEELDQGVEPKKKTPESACGSCYLGDAFRCASCPYLGMPAFKAGEKVVLVDRQLKADS